MAKIDKITIENAKTCSKNFSGEVTMYNAGGNRKFSVILDEDLALELIDDGWSIKAKPGKEDGDPMRYYLDVTVKYGKFPPVIKLVTSKGITTLDEHFHILGVGAIERATLPAVEQLVHGQVAVAGQHKVNALAPVQLAVHDVIDDEVIARPAGDCIRARATVQVVVARAAGEAVVAVISKEPEHTALGLGSIQHVITGTAVELRVVNL